MSQDLEKLIDASLEGDKKALNLLLTSIDKWVYNLALRMLLYPEDAKDATQEILVKIVTRLSTFKHQSSFKTWVYRVASNYLIDTKGKLSRKFERSFSEYEKLIETGISNRIKTTNNEGEIKLLEEEVKISCTHGLLLCLSEKSRLIYILGDILEFDSTTGGQILNIPPANFRKQLSRSRFKIKNFLLNKCGLANPKNPCKCKKKIDFLVENDVIDPAYPRFAHHTNRSIELVDNIMKLENVSMIYQSTPQFSTPTSFIRDLQTAIQTL